jgi:3-oxoacyl-[acyl-carrier protein] reductase
MTSSDRTDDPARWRLGPPAGARVAVLGGAGGIGRAVVQAARALGIEVAVLDLERSLAAHPPPAGCLALALDATRAESVDAAFAALAARWDRLDGFVGLAGFMTERTPIAELSPERWDELIQGNLRSAFLAARGALPLLRKGERPAMVFVSSGLALRVTPGYGGYAAAKAGLIAMTKALAGENAPGIRANCVAPGAVETEFLTGGTGRDRGRAQMDRAAYLRAIPMGRIAVADDVVGPILFLLGPSSGYMTGQVLYVNGGGLTP